VIASDPPVSLPPRITFGRLLELLDDPDTRPQDVQPYLLVDVDASGPFAPVVVPNPAHVGGDEAEAAVLLAVLNGWSRWVRHKRYREKLARGWNGPKLVSEGDSWFHYPFILPDVVDHLGADHAVFCSAAAGDMLADMVAQDEVVGAIALERPHAVLLSAGGNDLLGRLQTLLEPYDARRSTVDEYLGGTFDAFLEALIADYRRFLLRVVAHAHGAPVLCHSYGYALPRRGGRWLGRPLAALGIVDTGLQRAIVRRIVDRFHDRLAAVVSEPTLAGRVILVDCRDAVPADRWHDELHPNEAGYGLVAARFRRTIERVLARGAPPDAEADHEVPSGHTVARAALRLSTTHDEGTLLHEIGRRVGLAGGGGGAAEVDLLEVPWASRRALHPSFEAVGAALAARISGELTGERHHGGAGVVPATTPPARTPSGGDELLAQHLATLVTTTFALPPPVAAVVVAVVLRRVVTGDATALHSAPQALSDRR
jgi:hypothetical protein